MCVRETVCGGHGRRIRAVSAANEWASVSGQQKELGEVLLLLLLHAVVVVAAAVLSTARVGRVEVLVERRGGGRHFWVFSALFTPRMFSSAKIVSHFSLQKRENWTTFTLTRTFISPHVVGLRGSALKKNIIFSFSAGAVVARLFFSFFAPAKCGIHNFFQKESKK